MPMALSSSKSLQSYGYDLILGSIAAFYVFMVPYTKVEESFNVQAMHDILYYRHHLDHYDHLEFPGVVPRTFLGAFLVSSLAAPVVSIISLLRVPKIYGLIAGCCCDFRSDLGVPPEVTQTLFLLLSRGFPSEVMFHNRFAVRLVLGCIILSTLRFLRLEIRKKFGLQVEAFFTLLTALQFHLLFYCTRPLPNILAMGLVNLAYGKWLKGNFYSALSFLIFATLIFRCDMMLLLGPIGLEFLTTKSISLWKALRCCVGAALLSIGLTIFVDSVMWRKLVWPEFEVFWFNSVLNRSSEWGTHPLHWYFTSALPRSLLAAYPLFMLGTLLDRRLLFYILPVLSFIILYSKLPHKELRFIISSVPMFNLCAAVGASRIYNNRNKTIWKLMNIVMLGLFAISAGCTVITFMASYNNYPSGYALNRLHQISHMANSTDEQRVHIDTFAAMNGVSRFCEHAFPWRYSKEEGIPIEELGKRNFTYLVNEHAGVDGYKCLFSEEGFSRISIQRRYPPVSLVKEPKVYVHGNMKVEDVMRRDWPSC